MRIHVILLLVTGLVFHGRVRGESRHLHQTPLETMADVTNGLGVCVLQIISSPDTNSVLSPYGLVSMAVLVYEGTSGAAAAELYTALHLPWHRDIVRIGFRDLHRYLRSYFSSEGFLKGLILSKPNVHLRPTYVQVLQFYGFQPDTVPQMSSPSNDTTTATSARPVLQVTTMITPTTTAAVVTASDMTVTRTQGMATQEPAANKTSTDSPNLSPETTVTSKQKATTLLTTIVGETTTQETVTTEYILSQTTITNPVTQNKEDTSLKVEMSTKGMTTAPSDLKTTIPPRKATVIQETQIYDSTTNMNVLTLTDKEPPLLESMNMVLNRYNNTDKEETEKTETPNDITTLSDTTTPGGVAELYTSTTPVSMSDGVTDPTKLTEATTPGGVVELHSTITPVSMPDGETDPTRLLFDQLIPVTDQDIKKDILTKKTEPVPYSTIIVDTTIPLEDAVLLTTQSDEEIMENKGSSMLEAFVLLEKEHSNIHYDIDIDNTLKRSSEYEDLSKTSIEYSTPLSYFVSTMGLGRLNHTSLPYHTYDPENSVASEEHYHSSETTAEDDVSDGFPTLEPDSITFPRLRRSITSDERLGNWVAATWRSDPMDQWFWTYSGDKLVPVLTYTAYLPYAELPDLQATALQLPLDDVRYSLLVLLPKAARGLSQMLHSLQWRPLRGIIDSLKLTPVHAVIPAFTIIKHINLTPVLHKLGVRHVFDAFHANLGEMSAEPNLYVRSIEQTITISVRKYFANYKWYEVTPSQVDRELLVTHPFAYFVMDEQTRVALVAGTLVDPLQHSTTQ